MAELRTKLTAEYWRTVEIFYRRQYRIFRGFALWQMPRNVTRIVQLLYTIYFWQLVIFWMLLLDASLITHLILNIASMDEVIKVFFIFATAISVMGKYVTVKMNNAKYEELFRWMHADYMLPRNAHEAAFLKRAMQLSLRVRNSYTYLSLTALWAVLLPQYFLGRSELPISFYIPFNLKSIWIYHAAYLYQIISISILCLMNIAFDSLATSCFIYLKGQLDMLAHRLQNIDIAGNETQTNVETPLKQCIRYYLRLQELAKLMEELLSIPISIQILCSVLVLIANFYAMSFLSGLGALANFIKFLVYQICMLAQIFIMCYFANEVSLRSTDLSYAVYQANWFHWNKSNRRLLLLMMLRFDTPIRICTINRCYSFNLAAFTSIVNSSYTYFALLKKING